MVGVETLISHMEDEETETLLVEDVDEQDKTQMQIVGLGLGRTGTTSLAMALEIIGYTVIHDDEHPKITDLYAAKERGKIDWDEFNVKLGERGYNATFKTGDNEWVKDHPKIKAILTVQDNPDKYVDSWLVAAPFIDILEKRPFRWFETVQALMPSFEEEFRDETTGGNPMK